jgi:ParB family chromosome partitioning protein
MAVKIPRTVTPADPRTGTGLNEVFGKSADFPNIAEIDVADILENPHQARKYFDEDSIADLARTIEAHGLQQPIIVRKHEGEDRKFALVAGERRLRAHRLLGRKTIFAIVSAKDNPEILSLLENVQRQDLNAVELASGFAALAEKGESHENIGQIAGLKPSAVSRILGILKLHSDIIKEYPQFSEVVSRSTLTELTDIRNEDTQRLLWERAKEGKLTREEIRNRVKLERKMEQAGQGTPSSAATGHDMKHLMRTLTSIKANVLALDEHRNRLASEHREMLRDLRTRIDALLGESP